MIVGMIREIVHGFDIADFLSASRVMVAFYANTTSDPKSTRVEVAAKVQLETGLRS